MMLDHVSLITTDIAYTSTNNTKIILIERQTFFLPGADTPNAYVCASMLSSFHCLNKYSDFTHNVQRLGQVPHQLCNQLRQSLEKSAVK